MFGTVVPSKGEAFDLVEREIVAIVGLFVRWSSSVTRNQSRRFQSEKHRDCRVHRVEQEERRFPS